MKNTPPDAAGGPATEGTALLQAEATSTHVKKSGGRGGETFADVVELASFQRQLTQEIDEVSEHCCM